ncbi:MAG: outer membrane beta-barrel protein, partial [Limisphaerales bacterium]
NYVTRPKPFKKSSFGFEVSPSIGLNMPLDQTFIGLSYVYSLRWYDDRVKNSADHTHQFNAKLDHAFNERYKMELSDSFVISQEPTLLDQVGIISVPLRVNGNNIHNLAQASLSAQLTQVLGLEFTYANNLYDYDQSGPGSYSALLDRMEQVGGVNLRWQALAQTVAILGYQFGVVDYDSKDSLIPGLDVSPKLRNNRSHYIYVGADQNFNSKLSSSIRLGGQYADYYHQDETSISPYVDGNLTYSYNPGSYVQAGVRHARNQTDVLGFINAQNLTLDQESTTLYASVTHRITSKLTAGLLGQYQKSDYKNGSVDDQTDDFYLVGVNLAYRFNKNFLAEAGYNYNKLDSDIAGRSFSRNQVYIGIRATY